MHGSPNLIIDAKRVGAPRVIEFYLKASTPGNQAAFIKWVGNYTTLPVNLAPFFYMDTWKDNFTVEVTSRERETGQFDRFWEFTSEDAHDDEGDPLKMEFDG